MKLTGAAILVSRGMKVLQAAPAAYPYRWATNHGLIREQRPVLLGRVQPEVDVAKILVGAVLADAVHERGDLQLRAVRFDAPQLVLKDIVVAADFQIRSVGVGTNTHVGRNSL